MDHYLTDAVRSLDEFEAFHAATAADWDDFYREVEDEWILNLARRLQGTLLHGDPQEVIS